jgi:Flp pilus assembly protein TadG
MPNNRRNHRRRAGTVAVELLIVLPLLLSLLLGMVEFSMFLAARQQVTTASREGARVAALGGTTAEVQLAVAQFLGAGNLGNANAQVQFIAQAGLSAASGDAVQVIVSLPVTQAVPDLLAFAGISLQNQNIVASTVMRKE